MKLKKDQQGIAHVALFAVVAIVLSVTLFVGWKVWNTSVKKTDTTKATNSNASCNRGLDLEICISPSKAKLQPTDTLEFKASVKNISTKDYVTSGGGCDVGVSIKINNKEVYDMGPCPDVISNTTIKSGETKQYQAPISTRLLTSGDNKIELSWGNISSNIITVKLMPPDTTDKIKFEECYTAQSQKPYCVLISITIRDGFFQEGSSTCEDLEKYVRNLRLQAYKEFCNLSELGILSVSAPQNEADSIISNLKQLKEVESAGVDNNQMYLN